MGDDLTLPGRDAIRTPMQWSPNPGAGFSAAAETIRPVISTGEYRYDRVNVTAQRNDPNSLLGWFEWMIRTLRESPEAGGGSCAPIDRKFAPGILVHRADGRTGTMLFLHNLANEPTTVDIGDLSSEGDHPNQVFGDQDYDKDEAVDLSSLRLDGYGYRWIRLNRNRVG